MQFGAFVPQGWRLDLAHVEPGVARYGPMVEQLQRFAEEVVPHLR